MSKRDLTIASTAAARASVSRRDFLANTSLALTALAVGLLVAAAVTPGRVTDRAPVAPPGRADRRPR